MANQKTAKDYTLSVDLAEMYDLKADLVALADSIPDAIAKTLDSATERLRVHMKKKEYPPERPNQVYVRTGNLANRWSKHKFSREQWAIRNTAFYAENVVGDEHGDGQGPYLIGRWWKARDVIEEQMDIEIKKIGDEIFEHMRSMIKG